MEAHPSIVEEAMAVEPTDANESAAAPQEPTPVTLYPTRGSRMAVPLAVGPVLRLPTPPPRSPGSAPWLPGFV